MIFTNSLNSCDLTALGPRAHLKHPPESLPPANREGIGLGWLHAGSYLKSCVAMEVAVGLRASVQSFSLSQPRRQYLTPCRPRI